MPPGRRKKRKLTSQLDLVQTERKGGIKLVGRKARNKRNHRRKRVFCWHICDIHVVTRVIR